MDICERLRRYQAIEAYRKRPLIVYSTSTRPGTRALMAGDAVREFIDQLDTIDAGDAVDVLINSNGGDPLAAWKLMSILRERFRDINVLVPYAAFSAATLFALGADKIFMHPHASLGPIDPQIISQGPTGPRQFAYEDLLGFLRFLHQDVKLTEQDHLRALADKLFSSVDPVVVGAAKRASDLSAQVGERLLAMHLPQADDRKAKQIAVNLNKSFFAHGDAVSRGRAGELDLDIGKPDPALEKLMWEAYLAIESYMELRAPFSPLSIYLSDAAGAAFLKQPGPAAVPSPEVKYRLVHALVESPRVASEFVADGWMSAAKLPNGQINIAVTEERSAWRTVDVAACFDPNTTTARVKPAAAEKKRKKK